MSSVPKITFEDAVREKIPARIAVFGPSGSGKTYTALSIAQSLAGDGILAVIDTEHGRSRLYADVFPHKQYQLLPPHHPDHYIAAMHTCAEIGVTAVVMDSITHEWDGDGGVKDIVDNAKGRFGNNTHAAWSVGTPLHNKFVESILAAPFHVVATMRSKVEWVLEEGTNGKKTPRKVGLGPVQRDGIEYEFDICMLMDMDHAGTIVKTHAGDLFPQGMIVPEPGKEFAEALNEWLGGGADPKRPAAVKTAKAKVEESQREAAPENVMDQLVEAIEQLQKDFGDQGGEPWAERVNTRCVETFGHPLTELTATEADRILRSLEAAREQLTEKTAATA